MPMYEYGCANGHYFTRMLKLVDYQTPQSCACGAAGQKLISRVAIATDYPGYSCPVTGDWIEGRKAHEENLKKHGCRVFEAGEREGYERQRLADEAALDKSVEGTVDEFIAGKSADQIATLCNEVAAGADVAIARNTFRG